ncbi:hypothetical protein [Marinicella rhabdoformis]|uniref:hypothetical protein n=1 Tax=Marinicella rhabdoformis TaxID=2580566 RepID=UPI0012AEBC83|nr:hypothetical protein [Marinicella rhabdoformis]
MAKALGGSDYISIQKRIENKNTWLSSFGKGDNGLPYYLSSYIDLIDESGRCVRDDKRCFIPNDSASTIDQLGISSDMWLEELRGFKSVGFFSYHP